MKRAHLILSDSGGVQEEAPSLGKPLMILRENTERPEAVASSVARLVGGSPENLASMLDEAYQTGSWVDCVAEVENPFGCGDSARRIVEILTGLFRDAYHRQTKGSAGEAALPALREISEPRNLGDG